MSAGKNPYFRYRILHTCLSSKTQRYWTSQELLDKLAEQDLVVEQRTLNLDLQTIRIDNRLKYYAPIIYCRLHRGYHYTDPSFSLDSLPLTTDDLSILTQATHVFQHYKELPLFNQAQGIIEKLIKLVDHAKSSFDPSESVIEFEKAPYYKGMQHHPLLHTAIQNRQALCILYQKFTTNTTGQYIIHPYYLKEYKGRWYIIGYHENHTPFITLALDRIESIVDAPISFYENKGPKLSEYFKHAIGITLNDGGVHDIELWFSPIQANYIRTQHLHESQQIVSDTTEGMHVSLKLIINYELQALLLSFGPEVRVIKPLALKNKIELMHAQSMGKD